MHFIFNLSIVIIIASNYSCSQPSVKSVQIPAKNIYTIPTVNEYTEIDSFFKSEYDHRADTLKDPAPYCEFLHFPDLKLYTCKFIPYSNEIFNIDVMEYDSFGISKSIKISYNKIISKHEFKYDRIGRIDSILNYKLDKNFKLKNEDPSGLDSLRLYRIEKYKYSDGLLDTFICTEFNRKEPIRYVRMSHSYDDLNRLSNTILSCRWDEKYYDQDTVVYSYSGLGKYPQKAHKSMYGGGDYFIDMNSKYELTFHASRNETGYLFERTNNVIYDANYNVIESKTSKKDHYPDGKVNATSYFSTAEYLDRKIEIPLPWSLGGQSADLRNYFYDVILMQRYPEIRITTNYKKSYLPKRMSSFRIDFGRISEEPSSVIFHESCFIEEMK